eukprot:gnl/TRDRNA2_/TRDRNA2_46957_c0_seq1.p1 gnl/TRDRNA2_/TRDRNA2_46957_c0~~gnl/TRDRNA2_/TRDRNA2_46957_c0_seq1.p1  ORF type:complete len:355 (-),score=48.59 gnl/TRDRNA2_/TRDRNA2_46957_c0_seq1:66-1130(-)
MSSQDVEDPYAVLGVSRQAKQDEIDDAYFTRAAPHHPDLSQPSDAGPSKDFLRFSMAHWVICEPGRRDRYDHTGEADLRGFSLGVVMQSWVRGLITEGGLVDELAGQSFVWQSEAEKMEHYMHMHVNPHGRKKNQVSGIKFSELRCKLCGVVLRGTTTMLEHFGAAHNDDCAAWYEKERKRNKESFMGFMFAATGIGPKDFTLVDSSRTSLEPSEWMPEIHYGIEEAVERGLALGDPETSEAVEISLHRLPVEMTQELSRLQTGHPGHAGFVAPVNGQDPDLGLAFGPPMRLDPSFRTALREQVFLREVGMAPLPQTPSSGEISCICGFTCGTRTALARHLARFPGSNAHAMAA